MRDREIVARGSWLYARTTPKPVFIVRLDYDFWYAVAEEEDALEEGEVPDLNADGHAYYVSFHGFRDDGSFWPDSGSYRSVDDARAAAEARVPSPVTWRRTLAGRFHRN